MVIDLGDSTRDELAVINEEDAFEE